MNDNGHQSTILTVQNLSFKYPGKDKPVLDDLSFTVKKGEFISVLGANGSGKSTLLSCLNGSRKDYTGTIQVVIDSEKIISPDNQQDILELRQFIGTILQNPDDQIISSVVEEDVAFGPENLGLPKAEIKQRVKEALQFVELEHKASMPPQYLSGGELQRLCIAGVLAMKSKVLLLDEASSMLDKKYRSLLHSLLKDYINEGNTVIQVTHSLEEAIDSDRCIVLDQGKKVFDDSPAGLLSNPHLHSWGFRLPESVRMMQRCSRELPGFSFPWTSSFDPVQFADYLYDYITTHKNIKLDFSRDFKIPDRDQEFENGPFPVVFQGASHEYNRDSSFAARGMEKVSLRIPEKAKIAVIGHSGSGKSTLLKHINALLLPTEGDVYLLGNDVFDKNVTLKSLRKKIALGIQNPEVALFEREVAGDVGYGPANNGITGDRLTEAVTRALKMVDLPYDEFASREISTLSGGEKRRVALAGVFALESEIIVLDEPGESLDGRGKDQVFLILEEFRSQGKTVIFTTHSIDDVRDCDFVAVMDQGKLIHFAPPRELFNCASPEENPVYPCPWVSRVYRQMLVRGFSGGQVPLSAEEMFYVVGNYINGTEPTLGFISGSGESNPYTLFNKIESDIPSKKKRKKTGLEYFSGATFGQFVNKSSPLRNLNAGIKILGLILLSVLALICPSPVILGVSIVCILVLSYLTTRIKPSYLLHGFVRAIPFILLIILFQFVFSWPNDNSRVLLVIGPVDITVQEIIRSLMLVLRLITIMVLLTLYTAVTPLRETLKSVKKGLAPLRFIGFPVKDFSLSLGISLRFVPVLTDEAQRVVSAQLSRGGGYEGKGRIAAGIPLIVPLFIRSLERCTKLALAMEMRLYALDAGGYEKIRKIAAGGMLSAVVIVLGITRLGLIPWFAGVSLTILHVPVIIGAILEGPVVGLFIGFIFGVSTLIQSAISPAGPMDALFVNPLISILPRLFIGPVTWLFYILFSGQIGKKSRAKKLSVIRETPGIIVGSLAGSLTNTILVLSSIAVFGYMPWSLVYLALVANGLPEAAAAAVIVLAVVTAWKRIPRRKKRNKKT